MTLVIKHQRGKQRCLTYFQNATSYWRYALPIFAFVAIMRVLIAQSTETTAPTTLPPPSDRLPVDRASFDWTDQSRIDAFAPEPGTKRQLEHLK